jgi:hypothetical protein
VLSEGVSLVVDLLPSSINPDQVLLGGLDLTLDVLSVGSSRISGGLVLVGDVGELLDLSSQLLLLSSVELVSLGLGINVLLLEVSEDSQSGINGVDG